MMVSTGLLGIGLTRSPQNCLSFCYGVLVLLLVAVPLIVEGTAISDIHQQSKVSIQKMCGLRSSLKEAASIQQKLDIINKN